MNITDEQMARIVSSAMLLAAYETAKVRPRAQESADRLLSALRDAGFECPHAIVSKAADLAIAQP